MKPTKLTPWQQWAQEYCTNPEHNIYRHGIDGEDADKYSRAAWEECKRRCLEILEEEWEDEGNAAYERIKKL